MATGPSHKKKERSRWEEDWEEHLREWEEDRGGYCHPQATGVTSLEDYAINVLCMDVLPDRGTTEWYDLEDQYLAHKGYA